MKSPNTQLHLPPHLRDILLEVKPAQTKVARTETAYVDYHDQPRAIQILIDLLKLYGPELGVDAKQIDTRAITGTKPENYDPNTWVAVSLIKPADYDSAKVAAVYKDLEERAKCGLDDLSAGLADVVCAKLKGIADCLKDQRTPNYIVVHNGKTYNLADEESHYAIWIRVLLMTNRDFDACVDYSWANDNYRLWSTNIANTQYGNEHTLQFIHPVTEVKFRVSLSVRLWVALYAKAAFDPKMMVIDTMTERIVPATSEQTLSSIRLFLEMLADASVAHQRDTDRPPNTLPIVPTCIGGMAGRTVNMAVINVLTLLDLDPYITELVGYLRDFIKQQVFALPEGLRVAFAQRIENVFLSVEFSPAEVEAYMIWCNSLTMENAKKYLATLSITHLKIKKFDELIDHNTNSFALCLEHAMRALRPDTVLLFCTNNLQKSMLHLELIQQIQDTIFQDRTNKLYQQAILDLHLLNHLAFFIEQWVEAEERRLVLVTKYFNDEVRAYYQEIAQRKLTGLEKNLTYILNALTSDSRYQPFKPDSPDVVRDPVAREAYLTKLQKYVARITNNVLKLQTKLTTLLSSSLPSTASLENASFKENLRRCLTAYLNNSNANEEFRRQEIERYLELLIQKRTRQFTLSTTNSLKQGTLPPAEEDSDEESEFGEDVQHLFYKIENKAIYEECLHFIDSLPILEQMKKVLRDHMTSLYRLCAWGKPLLIVLREQKNQSLQSNRPLEATALEEKQTVQGKDFKQVEKIMTRVVRVDAYESSFSKLGSTPIQPNAQPSSSRPALPPANTKSNLDLLYRAYVNSAPCPAPRIPSIEVISQEVCRNMSREATEQLLNQQFAALQVRDKEKKNIFFIRPPKNGTEIVWSVCKKQEGETVEGVSIHYEIIKDHSESRLIFKLKHGPHKDKEYSSLSALVKIENSNACLPPTALEVEAFVARIMTEINFDQLKAEMGLNDTEATILLHVAMNAWVYHGNGNATAYHQTDTKVSNDPRVMAYFKDCKTCIQQRPEIPGDYFVMGFAPLLDFISEDGFKQAVQTLESALALPLPSPTSTPSNSVQPQKKRKEHPLLSTFSSSYPLVPKPSKTDSSKSHLSVVPRFKAHTFFRPPGMMHLIANPANFKFDDQTNEALIPSSVWAKVVAAPNESKSQQPLDSQSPDGLALLTAYCQKCWMPNQKISIDVLSHQSMVFSAVANNRTVTEEYLDNKWKNLPNNSKTAVWCIRPPSNPDQSLAVWSTYCKGETSQQWKFEHYKLTKAVGTDMSIYFHLTEGPHKEKQYQSIYQLVCKKSNDHLRFDHVISVQNFAVYIIVGCEKNFVNFKTEVGLDNDNEARTLLYLAMNAMVYYGNGANACYVYQSTTDYDTPLAVYFETCKTVIKNRCQQYLRDGKLILDDKNSYLALLQFISDNAFKQAVNQLETDLQPTVQMDLEPKF